MKQDKFSGDWRDGQRNAILLIMITILIVYIAVPIYGVIHDVKEGGTVFVIESSDAEGGQDLLDKVVDFLFDSNEVKVETAYIVDLRGFVIDSNKNPYADGIVELRSTPRYTRTDKDGYFIFRSVEAGKHTINVLDESGNTLATCNVDLTTAKKTEKLVTTSFSDNTYRINVSVNVQVLEIKITLRTDEDGNVQGIGALEVVKAETEPMPQKAPETEPKDMEPQPPEDGSLDEPEVPVEEPEPPVPGGKDSPGGGGGGAGPAPDPFPFGVYDSGTSSSFGKTAVARVNIFGEDKLIAPGMKGSYRFTVDNTRNSYRSKYTVDFIKSDTLPAGSKIPMVFRLKQGSSYVAGDASTWRTAEQLHQDTSIAANAKTVYTLEWFWPEGSNDNLFSGSGNDRRYSYTLRIEVSAQQE